MVIIGSMSGSINLDQGHPFFSNRPLYPLHFLNECMRAFVSVYPTPIHIAFPVRNISPSEVNIPNPIDLIDKCKGASEGTKSENIENVDRSSSVRVHVPRWIVEGVHVSVQALRARDFSSVLIGRNEPPY